MKEINHAEILLEIYEKISDKTLSFGCKIFVKEIQKISYTEKIIDTDIFVGEWVNTMKTLNNWEIGLFWPDASWLFWDVIGHPVMIGDVIDCFSQQKVFIQGSTDYILHNDIVEIIKLWENKRAPIEEQSNDCILYIYSLLRD